MSDTLNTSQSKEELGYPADEAKESSVGLPPGSGNLQVPHYLSFSSIINSVTRVYRYTFDEALKHSRENALALKRDPVIRDALKARKIPTAQLSWHIEVEDENDPKQAEIQEKCTRFIDNIPNFQRLKMNLLDAIFYGRSGVQLEYQWDWSEGKRELSVRDHVPINGDKLVFTFGGEVGVVVHGTYSGTSRLTERGRTHFFTPEERESIIIHKHEVADADFYEPELAGAIHGVGVRDEIYWFWFLKVKVFEWLMDYLERVGAGGFTVYYYDSGNPASLAEVKKAAEEQFRNNTILFPRNRDNKDTGAGIQRIETSVAGSQLLQELVTNYFDNQIRAFILGMKIEDENAMTIGTGNSDFKAERLSRIVKYDGTALQESITDQLIKIKVKYDFPGYENKVKFKFDTDAPDVKQTMEAAKMFWELGGSIDEEDLRTKLGLPKPEAGKSILAKIAPMSPVATGSAPTGVPMAGAPGPDPQVAPGGAPQQQDIQSVL